MSDVQVGSEKKRLSLETRGSQSGIENWKEPVDLQ